MGWLAACVARVLSGKKVNYCKRVVHNKIVSSDGGMFTAHRPSILGDRVCL